MTFAYAGRLAGMPSPSPPLTWLIPLNPTAPSSYCPFLFPTTAKLLEKVVHALQFLSHPVFFLINLFIFGCVGSSLLRAGFL